MQHVSPASLRCGSEPLPFDLSRDSTTSIAERTMLLTCTAPRADGPQRLTFIHQTVRTFATPPMRDEKHA